MMHNDYNECPDCGDGFERIGRHFSANPSHRPEITENEMEMLKGLLMGDGCIIRSGKNPALRLEITNRTYAEYLKSKYPMLFNSIHQKEPRTESRTESYCIDTIQHPDLSELSAWYNSGKKVFPNDIQLTPLLVKHWYCCDGGLDFPKHGYGKAKISTVKERPEKLVEYFRNAGFDARAHTRHVYFPSGATQELLGWMGPPPSGFEYKWEWRYRDQYENKKNQTDYQEPDKDALAGELRSVANRLDAFYSPSEFSNAVSEAENEVQNEYEQKLNKVKKQKQAELEQEIDSTKSEYRLKGRNDAIRLFYDAFANLSEDELERITQNGGITQTQLSEHFDITQSMISHIVSD